MSNSDSVYKYVCISISISYRLVLVVAVVVCISEIGMHNMSQFVSSCFTFEREVTPHQDFDPDKTDSGLSHSSD